MVLYHCLLKKQKQTLSGYAIGALRALLNIQSCEIFVNLNTKKFNVCRNVYV